MTEAKPKLLIIEDDLDLADMLTAYFRVEGYEVVAVNRGEEGVQVSKTTHPDLILLDVRLPDIDGVEVVDRLHGVHKAADIPIIFLTDKLDLIDDLRGLELGVDGYITKPFDVQDLRLRVRNVLRRVSQDTLTNPVTGLPEGKLVDDHLRQYLQKPEWTALIISLDNLDNFRDIYGFVASDDVLRAVSLMLQNAIRDTGGPDDFIGHMDTAVFILVTDPGVATKLQDRICGRLERSLEYFYPIKDREKSARDDNRLVISIKALQSTDAQFSTVEGIKDSFWRNNM
jgi:PleD family two-component response regulator